MSWLAGKASSRTSSMLNMPVTAISKRLLTRQMNGVNPPRANHRRLRLPDRHVGTVSINDCWLFHHLWPPQVIASDIFKYGRGACSKANSPRMLWHTFHDRGHGHLQLDLYIVGLASYGMAVMDSATQIGHLRPSAPSSRIPSPRSLSSSLHHRC